jgi:hypothetical protein
VLPILGLEDWDHINCLFQIRRPGQDMKNLYDVFRAIRADEADHVSTMKACLDDNVLLISPSLEKKVLIGTGIVSAAAALLSSGDFEGTSDIFSINPSAIAVGGVLGSELDALLDGAGAVISQWFGGGSDVAVKAQEIAGSVEAIEDTGLIAQFLGEGFAAGFIASKLMSGKKDQTISDNIMPDVKGEEVEVNETNS